MEDAMNVVSTKFLVSRITNQIYCWWSYTLSLLGIVKMKHLPTFISVEPTNICQLRCPECPVSTRMRDAKDANFLSLNLFQNILTQVQATVHTMQFFFQGEPLLNSQLPKMIELAHETGMYTIVSTNAQRLNQQTAFALVKSGLNRIIVSIDGFSEESYAAYRVGGNLQRALESLHFLQEAKTHFHSKIRIELQVLRLRTNEHEWQWIQRHYKKLGATHLVFKTAQLYSYKFGHPLMPSNPRYSRYKKSTDGTYHLHRTYFQRNWFNTPCYRLWSGGVITARGELLPCCYDKNSTFSFGSILQHPIKQLWHSPEAYNFRLRTLHHQNSISICKECNQ